MIIQKYQRAIWQFAWTLLAIFALIESAFAASVEQTRLNSASQRLEQAFTQICGIPSLALEKNIITANSLIKEHYAVAAVHPQIPWIAKLDIIEDNYSDISVAIANCGATALTRNWLITAAHCVNTDSWNDVTVTLGAQNLEDPRALQRQVSLALCPKFYTDLSLHTGEENPDIALLRLDQALPSNFPTLRVASTDEMRRLMVGGVALSAGWPRQGSEISSHLNTSIMQMQSPEEEPPGVLVTKPIEEDSALCVGESGAPLVADLGFGPSLIGVFSSVDAVLDPDSGEVHEICAGPEAKSYFTSVSGLQDWISAAIRACDLDVEACLQIQK